MSSNPAVPFTESVDEIPRRGNSFRVNYALIHEFSINVAPFTISGAQLIIPRNPGRIRAVLYAPTDNSGTIYIGGQDMQPAAGDRLTGPNGLEMEPGTGWEIDDTIAPIYAMSQKGTGDQALRWYEAVDDYRVPPLVSR